MDDDQECTPRGGVHGSIVRDAGISYADDAPDGPILVSGPVQMVSVQDCLNGGGRPNYFGSHGVCQGGLHNGEYINS